MDFFNIKTSNLMSIYASMLLPRELLPLFWVLHVSPTPASTSGCPFAISTSPAAPITTYVKYIGKC